MNKYSSLLNKVNLFYKLANQGSKVIDPAIQRILGVEDDGQLGPQTRKAIEAKKAELAKKFNIQPSSISDSTLFSHLLTGSPITQSFQQAEKTTGPTTSTIPSELKGFIPESTVESFQQAAPTTTPAVDFNTAYEAYIKGLQSPVTSFQQAQPTTAPTATTIPPGLQGFIPSTQTQSFQQAQPSTNPAVDFNTAFNEYMKKLQQKP